MDCLIVRQPYASLIAFGKKRWEFRRYPTEKTGRIGVASSPSEPLKTLSPELNKIAHLFPRGVILATANLVTSFYVTGNDLRKNRTDPVLVEMHGFLVETSDKPIGEPLADIDYAIKRKGWESFAFLLEDIEILNEPKPFERTSPRSTWVKVEI